MVNLTMSGHATEPDPVAIDPVSARLLELARRVARSRCTILLAGESGTGKEVLARYIHRHSTCAAGPFVAINCAAIPDNMLEGLLFGWERGAFTGAHAAHAGKFERAQGGTLLLDEVSELPLALQAQLLRVLQEREVERLGGRGALPLDVRVLASTNRRLRADVADGRFREDLYYRLNVFPLVLQPLRARRADILPLAMRLLALHSAPGARLPAVRADAAQVLLTHSWPGNVRELENVMQRAMVLSDGDQIRASDIERAQQVDALAAEADRTLDAAPNAPLASTLAHTEQQLILEALRSTGSRARVAARLGISPRTLRYKLARMRAAGVDLATLAGSVA
ncbi:MAG: sigma-54-dependent Fis family transcriptional regulator [Gammaproteobacteria bacterium]|nr:sigma-54-dependent Fis family transcriptional regulator [Gammaproteobacteria bacterium]